MTLIRTAYGAVAFLLLVVVISCAGAPKSIPDTLIVPELIQNAQNSTEDGNFKAAEAYYQAIIDRFPDNKEATCIAEFEIAHLRIKEHKWADAKIRLEALLQKFEADTTNELPDAYRILAASDYKKIPVASDK